MNTSKTRTGKSRFVVDKPYGWWHISYNGVHIGSTYQEEIPKDPDAWGERQLKKRLMVIKRNIQRLSKELKDWEAEQKLLES